MMRVGMTPKDPRLRTGGHEREVDCHDTTTPWHNGQGHTPPHDLNFERSVLVSMLMDPGTIEAVKNILTPDDFYPSRHKQIIGKTFEMHSRGEPVDLVTVGSACNGQAAYLAELTDHPIASNVAHYARKVAHLAQRRRLWAAGHKITQLALNGAAEGDPVGLAMAEIEATRSGRLLFNRWPELLPLGPEDPPPLPVHLWAPVLRDYAVEASAETETPPELPAMLAMGCVAAAVQRVVSVEIKPGYREPCCINAVVTLPPASRKSSEHARAIRPLAHWEGEMRNHFAARIETAASLLATHKTRVGELRKQAARTKDNHKAAELAAELAKIEAEAPVVPMPPRCFTSDVTAEHLATMMEQNGGAMAVISAEGGIFETIAGRYSNQIPNLDIYLMGHAGDPVRVDRGSRPPVMMDNPRLTMVLTIQPDVLAALKNKPGFRGRGLLGRVLFCLPPSRLGCRRGDARPMRAEVRAEYDRTISALLDVAHGMEPYTLQIEPAAYDAWLAYWREVETEMADGGSFEYMRDWAGKLPGAVGRIAALFHSARYPEHLDTLKVSAEDMQAAIETGRALAGHAQAAFGQMSSDPAVEDARLLLNWIKRRGLIEFTAREAQQNYNARFTKAAELEPPLGVLAERGYIRERIIQPGAKGGRPSKVFDVNPEVLQVL